MTRVLTAALLLASAALGVFVVAELARPPALADLARTAAGRPLPASPAAALRDDGQRRSEEVAMILARPVFSPTRRPKTDAAAPAEAAAPITSLPRMTAILVNGKLRSAIFDGAGKPTVLGEGGHLGPFTIQSIEPQQVTIVGPDGKRVVRTSFSNAPPPAPAFPTAFTPTIPQGMPLPTTPVILPPGIPTPPGPSNPGPSR